MLHSHLVGLFFISSTEAVKEVFRNEDGEAKSLPSPSPLGWAQLQSSLVNIVDEAIYRFLFSSLVNISYILANIIV